MLKVLVRRPVGEQHSSAGEDLLRPVLVDERVLLRDVADGLLEVRFGPATPDVGKQVVHVECAGRQGRPEHGQAGRDASDQRQPVFLPPGIVRTRRADRGRA